VQGFGAEAMPIGSVEKPWLFPRPRIFAPSDLLQLKVLTTSAISANSGVFNSRFIGYLWPAGEWSVYYHVPPPPRLQYVRPARGLGSVSSIQSLITSVANQFGVPASIALGVAQKESGFNQNAVGAAGEIGVFQLMPATASGLGVNPSDLNQNVTGGVSLLASLYQQFGNWSDALAAYNAGPTHLAAGQSYASSILGSISDPSVDPLASSGDPVASSGDSLAADLTDYGLPVLSASGTSPWVWAGLALAGFGMVWWASG
jgi:Transglycosylase SLT domain